MRFLILFILLQVPMYGESTSQVNTVTIDAAMNAMGLEYTQDRNDRDIAFTVTPVHFLENDVCLCEIKVDNCPGSNEGVLFCMNTGNRCSPTMFKKVFLKDSSFYNIRSGKEEKVLFLPVCAKAGFKTSFYLLGKDFRVSASVIPRPLTCQGSDGASFSIIRREVGGNIIQVVVTKLQPFEKILLRSISEDECFEKEYTADKNGVFHPLDAYVIYPAVIGVDQGIDRVSIVRKTETLSLNSDWDYSTVSITQ